MLKYRVPEGYQLDTGSGLYYKEQRLTGPDGRLLRHFYWFNAETGEYSQAVYLLEEQAVGKTTPEKHPKRKRRPLRVAAVLVILAVLICAGALISRNHFTPKYMEPTQEQIDWLTQETVVPDPDTHPTFGAYEGGLHTPGEESQ